VVRTQPVAVSPRDFVDEWTVSPWEQAAEWSSRSAIGELEQMHEALSKRTKTANDVFELRFRVQVFRQCGPYQVEVIKDKAPGFRTSRSVYFQVLGGSTYSMDRVSGTGDPRCTGRNILEEMSTK